MRGATLERDKIGQQFGQDQRRERAERADAQRTGNIARHVARQIAQIVRGAQEIARRDQQAFTRRSER